MLPDTSKWYFWRRRGWLRYPLLGLLLVGTAMALRGGLWSQTPAKAAKRAAKRGLKAKSKALPKVQMFLEHNERDINLKIKKGKYVLPSPVITREDRKVIVELAGVQVRPRKWTLSGSRVSSINVKVDKKGSKLVIAQDPKVKGTLKDAFSAEDVNGNLVLRVLNQSIGDRQRHPARLALQSAPTKIVGAGTAPVLKAKHPLSQKLNHKQPPSHHSPQPKTVGHHQPPARPQANSQHKVLAQPKPHHGAPAHPQPAHAPAIAHPKTPEPASGHHGPQHSDAPAPVHVVEHPAAEPHEPAHPVEDANHPTMVKSALSMAASVLAFGLLALIPILWWKKKQTSPTGDIKIQERLALSPKHSLVRVKLGHKDLWLGLSEGNIQVISPAQTSAGRPALAVVPDPVRPPAPLTEEMDDADHDRLPEPMPAAAPPTLARRKLAAFKHRLREALAHPDSEPDLAQDAGRQADAIRRELARRQAEQMLPEDAGFEEHVA